MKRNHEQGAIQRLYWIMDARHDELRLRWVDVADKAGVSPATIRALRQGRSVPGPVTKRGLEQALGWGSGSIDQILEGGEAIPLEAHTSDTQTALDLEAMHADLDALEAELDRRVRWARRDPRELAQVLEAIREIQDGGDAPGEIGVSRG